MEEHINNLNLCEFSNIRYISHTVTHICIYTHNAKVAREQVEGIIIKLISIGTYPFASSSCVSSSTDIS